MTLRVAANDLCHCHAIAHLRSCDNELRQLLRDRARWSLKLFMDVLHLVPSVQQPNPSTSPTHGFRSGPGPCGSTALWRGHLSDEGGGSL